MMSFTQTHAVAIRSSVLDEPTLQAPVAGVVKVPTPEIPSRWVVKMMPLKNRWMGSDVATKNTQRAMFDHGMDIQFVDEGTPILSQLPLL